MATSEASNDDVKVLMEGYGMKQGGSHKTWKKRYFVLRTSTNEERNQKGLNEMGLRVSHMLLYYKNKDDVKNRVKEKGGFLIKKWPGTSVVVDATAKGGRLRKSRTCIKLHTVYFKRILYFDPPTDMKDKWVEMLSKLEVPKNAAELRRMTYGAAKLRPVSMAQLNGALDGDSDDDNSDVDGGDDAVVDEIDDNFTIQEDGHDEDQANTLKKTLLDTYNGAEHEDGHVNWSEEQLKMHYKLRSPIMVSEDKLLSQYYEDVKKEEKLTVEKQTEIIDEMVSALAASSTAESILEAIRKCHDSFPDVADIFSLPAQVCTSFDKACESKKIDTTQLVGLLKKHFIEDKDENLKKSMEEQKPEDGTNGQEENDKKEGAKKASDKKEGAKKASLRGGFVHGFKGGISAGFYVLDQAMLAVERGGITRGTKMMASAGVDGAMAALGSVTTGMREGMRALRFKESVIAVNQSKSREASAVLANLVACTSMLVEFIDLPLDVFKLRYECVENPAKNTGDSEEPDLVLQGPPPGAVIPGWLEKIVLSSAKEVYGEILQKEKEQLAKDKNIQKSYKHAVVTALQNDKEIYNAAYKKMRRAHKIQWISLLNKVELSVKFMNEKYKIEDPVEGKKVEKQDSANAKTVEQSKNKRGGYNRPDQPIEDTGSIAQLKLNAAYTYSYFNSFLGSCRADTQASVSLGSHRLKKSARIHEKQWKRGGKVSTICDVLRGQVIVKDFYEMQQVHDWFMHNPHVEIFEVKDRLNNATSGGWRDIVYLFRIVAAITPHIVEVQVALEPMVVARKGMDGHHAYASARHLDEMLNSIGVKVTVL